MVRPKKREDSQRIHLNLSKKTIELIDYFCSIKEIKSKSDFIEFLVTNFYEGENPLEKLEAIKNQKDKLKTSIEKLEDEEKLTLQRLKNKEDYMKEKQIKRTDAVKNIIRKFNKGDPEYEIEEIARFWGMRLNIDYVDLIFEAKKQIHKTVDI